MSDLSPSQPPLTRSAARASRTPPRAGRNLPAAVGVGVGLGVVVIASLFIRREAFIAVVVVAVCLAVWELSQALSQRHVHVPLPPVAVGAVAMLVAAYSAGGQALVVCFVLTAVGVLVWRSAETPHGALRDVAGGVFTAAYLPLLAGFVILMLAEDDGAWRVLTFMVVTVCSDVGGYALGVVAGRHPMAPSVSPKKSWEGFAGSVIACVVGGAVMMPLALDAPWWSGVALGAAVVATATVGDLAESMIKRDLGIKDMGSVLPGHGGVMDRLDSLLVTAPVAWLLLHLLA
ncbi:MAG: phosphatidate cytidylyltransferase [Angustibacter sp.]